MIGLFGVADPPSPNNNMQLPRLLDGELQHAEWYTRSDCISGLKISNDPTVWNSAVKQYDTNIAVESEGAIFRVPGKIAIAHNLIASWANNIFMNQDSNHISSSSSSSKSQ